MDLQQPAQGVAGASGGLVGKIRILVVDDEIDAAEGVQDILELEGHIVGVAHDKASALQAAKLMVPDVALVDLRLKDEWGLDVIAALHREFPALVCIVQTGNSDSSVVIAALRQGVYDYLIKPFQPDQLLTVIARAAEKITLEKDRFQIIEELGKAKEQAELASKSKTEFLIRMGREFSDHFACLTELAGSMAQQKLGPVGDEKYLTCARGIASGCSRMLSNMRQIGLLGTLEAGKAELSITDFSLPDAVAMVVEKYRGLIDHKQLVMEIALDEAIPVIQSDQDKFMGVLFHLLGNAVKFSDSAGRIAISAQMDEKGDLWVQINDHGPGMPESQIAMAMAPFGQLQPQQGASTAHDPFCAGLGLPLASGLVHLLGGKIGLKSAVGAGTSARVFFPKDQVFEFARMRNSVL